MTERAPHFISNACFTRQDFYTNICLEHSIIPIQLMQRKYTFMVIKHNTYLKKLYVFKVT